MEYTIQTSNEIETREMAAKLAADLLPGDVIGLAGTLGAGKTTFVQGLASGLGVAEKIYVNSPTFTIINQYPCTKGLYHLDFYRLRDEEELIETGFEDVLSSGSVVIIEWFDILVDAMPKSYLKIKIDDLKDKRNFSFFPIGEDWKQKISSLSLWNN